MFFPGGDSNHQQEIFKSVTEVNFPELKKDERHHPNREETKGFSYLVFSQWNGAIRDHLSWKDLRTHPGQLFHLTDKEMQSDVKGTSGPGA